MCHQLSEANIILQDIRGLGKPCGHHSGQKRLWAKETHLGLSPMRKGPIWMDGREQRSRVPAGANAL